jgi:hypothetical protein
MRLEATREQQQRLIRRAYPTFAELLAHHASLNALMNEAERSMLVQIVQWLV